MIPLVTSRCAAHPSERHVQRLISGGITEASPGSTQSCDRELDRSGVPTPSHEMMPLRAMPGSDPVEEGRFSPATEHVRFSLP